MHRRTAIRIAVLSFAVSCGGWSPGARAATLGDWEIFPTSTYQQYQTYGLYLDNQSLIDYYGANDYFGSVGGAFAVAGNSVSKWHPQVVIIASVNAHMVFAESGRIYSDEIDVHAGGAYNFTISPEMRMSIGFMHYSGHVADGAVDPSLLAEDYNLGDNMLFARFVYDFGTYVRAGVTFQPVVHGGPAAQFWAGNAFAEYFPFGGRDEQEKPSPYVAASLIEDGTDMFGSQLTFHAQVGCYFGNHFSSHFKPTFRPVAGFYYGADPRLKYYQFQGFIATFAYVGAMVDF
jgi:hypothetical protein